MIALSLLALGARAQEAATTPAVQELQRRAEAARKAGGEPWVITAEKLARQQPLVDGRWTVTKAWPLPAAADTAKLAKRIVQLNSALPHVSEAMGGKRYEYIGLRPQVSVAYRADSVLVTWTLQELEAILNPDLRSRHEEQWPLVQCHPWFPEKGLRKVAQAKATLVAQQHQLWLFQAAQGLIEQAAYRSGNAF